MKGPGSIANGQMIALALAVAVLAKLMHNIWRFPFTICRKKALLPSLLGFSCKRGQLWEQSANSNRRYLRRNTRRTADIRVWTFILRNLTVSRRIVCNFAISL